MLDSMLRSFFGQLTFFTRIPIPRSWQDQRLECWPGLYPFSGLVVGLLVWGAIELVFYFELIFLAQLVAFALPLLLTGGLHLDGLADSADGLFFPGSTQRRLEIMRDSKIGVYAVIALVVDLLIRWELVQFLIIEEKIWAIALAPAVGKIGILMLLGFGKSVDDVGKIAGSLADRISIGPGALWLIILVAGWFFLGQPWIWWPLVFLSGLLSWWGYRRLKGVNGDLCGWTNEVWVLGFYISAL